MAQKVFFVKGCMFNLTLIKITFIALNIVRENKQSTDGTDGHTDVIRHTLLDTLPFDNANKERIFY